MSYFLIKVKYRLQRIKYKLLFCLGFEKMLLKNRYGERVLVFHGIDKVGETKYNSRFVSEAYFKNFIQYISQHFNVISIDDFYAKKFKKNTLNIAITFDDGYFNNYKYAVPILEKYQIPASFYSTTISEEYSFLWADFIDLISYYAKKKQIVFDGNTYIKNKKNEFIFNGKILKNRCKELPFCEIKKLFVLFKEDWQEIQKMSLSDYWQLMNNAQIKEIANHSLFTLGAHSKTHANLLKISISEAKQEIAQSKETLEAVCKKTMKEFAFPFGYYNDELVDYTKALGFSKILLVGYNSKRDQEDTALQERFVINPYISEKEQLYFLLKGSYY